MIQQIVKRVNDTQNTELDIEITKDEIAETIKRMKKRKATGS